MEIKNRKKRCPKVEKICKQCSVRYLVHAYRAEASSYCTHNCHSKSLIGVAPKVNNKGKAPWIKGKKHKAETLLKIGDRYYPKGEEHFSWIGDSIGYYGVHDWINKIAGKPSKCERCGTTEYPKYEWANRSRKYKRLRTDWIRLCIPCHRKVDYYQIKL